MTLPSPSPSILQATDLIQCLLCANILLGAWDIMEVKRSLQTGRGHTEWLKTTNMNVYVQTELGAVKERNMVPREHRLVAGVSEKAALEKRYLSSYYVKDWGWGMVSVASIQEEGPGQTKLLWKMERPCSRS